MFVINVIYVCGDGLQLVCSGDESSCPHSVVVKDELRWLQHQVLVLMLVCVCVCCPYLHVALRTCVQTASERMHREIKDIEQEALRSHLLLRIAQLEEQVIALEPSVLGTV